MVFDDIDISKLPGNSEAAFAEFERKIREVYERASRDDRDHNADQDGNYLGSYDPERAYVTAILAFLDEYDLETDVEDITALDDGEFFRHFKRFKAKIQYITTRYVLRKNRIATGGIGTLIEIPLSYKSVIGDHLEKIRKIVNQELDGSHKKDKIFAKIAALQSEVDRDQTTVDAAFGRVLDLSRIIGEAGGNLKPAIEQLERVKKIFWDKSEKVGQLPKPERPKAISKQDEPSNQSDSTEDEIPF